CTLLWAAAYYHHPIGEVLTHALPGLLRRRERAAPRPATPHWRLTTAGRAALDDPALRAPRQRSALAALAAVESLPEPALRADGVAAAVLRRLESKGWVERTEAPVARRCAPIESEPPPELTAEQRAVLDAIAADPPGYRCYLLHGATGSGKTEVYLRLIAAERAAGRQTLLLVPE